MTESTTIRMADLGDGISTDDTDNEEGEAETEEAAPFAPYPSEGNDDDSMESSEDM